MQAWRYRDTRIDDFNDLAEVEVEHHDIPVARLDRPFITFLIMMYTRSVTSSS